MPAIPENYALAGGFAAARRDAVWELLRDSDRWPDLFPEWIRSLEQDDDRYTATGPRQEKFDLYFHADGDRQALDVEVVDELGSADTLRLRVLDMPGGTLVVDAHGRLRGTSDDSWIAKRDAVEHGLHGIGDLL